MTLMESFISGGKVIITILFAEAIVNGVVVRTNVLGGDTIQGWTASKLGMGGQ